MGETNIFEPMTNEEWLRSCSTEELAKWLKDVAGFDYKVTLEWLKEEHYEL